MLDTVPHPCGYKRSFISRWSSSTSAVEERDVDDNVWDNKEDSSSPRADTTATLSSKKAEEVKEQPPLVQLDNATLSFPSSKNSSWGPWSWSVHSPGATGGGHVVLGRNGAGKSLLSTTLESLSSSTVTAAPNDGDTMNGIERVSDYIKSGSLRTEAPWYSNSIAHVSFESHEALLAAGGTVSKAISRGGNLSKAAQFLVVRFGLYPLLHRDVTSLSTGEIRKVLIVRALANRPRLLVIDNGFDGLDVPSRESLKELISKTILGFRPDILVQAVNANATAHTQVLLMTHRAEEIVDEIEAVSTWDMETGQLVTMPRNGQSGQKLLHAALNIDSTEEHKVNHVWDDPDLPSIDTVANVWAKLRNPEVASPGEESPKLVQASNLTLRRGEATLLDNLNWEVKNGECWLVAGGNGAGKSTLSRFLAKNDNENGVTEGTLSVSSASGIGWVSTELHMATARSTKTGREVLLQGGQGGDEVPEEVAEEVASWLYIDHSLLSRPFSELSQGQQKIILIASALASRCKVIVLDEPCQGLDYVNRNRVLKVVERICRATDTTLIYITHHLEEVIPSVTHVLHLTGGKAVYNGTWSAYDPNSV